MSGVLEYVVCIVLIWVVATCLFELCVVFILLKEGYRELRCFANSSVNSLRAASAESSRAATATSNMGRQVSDPVGL